MPPSSRAQRLHLYLDPLDANPSTRSCRSPGSAATSSAHGSPISKAFRACRRRPPLSWTSRSARRPSVCVIAGAALLMARSSDRAAVPLAWALLIGVAAFAAAIAAFVLVQHRSMFVVFARLARRLAPEKWLSGFKGGASAIDDAVVATYRRGFALFRANLLHLAGWAAGSGAIWLLMHFLSRPFALADAFVHESLGQGVRSAAFLAPGALGALEGGFVLFGALLELPADIAL